MDIKAILRREVESFARKGFNGYGVFLANEDAAEYSVIWHPQDRQQSLGLMLTAGIVDGKIWIYEEHTIPTLSETLIDAGISQDDIVIVRQLSKENV